MPLKTKNQHLLMHKLTALLLCIAFFSVRTFSQNITLTGSVKDTTEKKAVKNAVVALLTVKDSILYRFVRTDAEGNFTLKNVKAGKYVLMTTHPYFADLLDEVEVKETTAQLGTIALTSKSKLLQEVIVKSGSPIKIKGDTTIYTADSFKVSANANVEELLKKLPGIQVDKNGTIKAMGETVEKVLVDGEEFFGDDPGMAVKNLRADAVKEVQVFDKKSDQAEFTGIDDGKTQKTINLKLKDDKKKGYFGKIDAAGGTQKNIDDRYNTNTMLSSFKGKRKFSGYLLNGNTGQDGLNWQDNEKFGGENDNMSMSMDDDGGVMMMWRGGSSDDEPYVNTENGFITNVNAGIQYSNKWNDKQTLNISPKYNSQLYTNGRKSFTQTQLGDSVLNENSATNTNVNRRNFKTSASYSINLDSNNTLKLTAKANFYKTESEEYRTGISTGKFGTLKNTSDRLLQTNSDKQAFTGSALYKHKFKKARRTLSLNADWNMINTQGTNYLKSKNQSYSDGLPYFDQTLNQMKDNDKSTQNLSSRFVYTEPLSKKYSLELAHEITYNFGNNDQITYTYNPGSTKYDVVVDSLSNRFNQSIVVNKPSFKINYGGKKLKYNFGSGFGLTHFDLIDKSFNKDYVRNYTNFFPAATLTYTYKSNHSLRVNYNGYTSQPNINQLQPLRNNNDYYNQYIGNPDLKPSFSNSFNISHNGYDFIKDRWTYQSLNVNFVNNSITNSRTINIDSGKTVSQPINTNGNYFVNFWSGIGFKSKKLNTRFNINPNVNFSRRADVVNGKYNYSKTLSAGMQVYISKSKDKKYDVSLSNDFTYNSNNSTQYTSKINYYTNRVSADATIYIKKVWSISSDFNFYSRQKTPQFNTNLNNQLWNARAQRTFKKDEFTAYVLVRDILNQNVGIQRNFYSNTLTEESNDRLKRYFMVGFTWNFKNKSAKAK